MTTAAEQQGTPGAAEITRDLFIGGRAVVYQPGKGRHRSGSDAVLLAASLPEGLAGHGYDLGSASGAAGLCALARLAGVRVTLVDVDAGALELARRGLADPDNAALAARAEVLCADVTAPEKRREADGLTRESADFVLCNPPYYRADAVRVSPKEGVAAAHVLGDGGLDAWVKCAVSVLRPGGLAAFILTADSLRDALDGFAGRFGDLAILPLHPYADAPASRVIVHGVKGARGALRLLPGWVLRERSGATGEDLGYTKKTRAILRDAAGMVAPPT